MNWVLKFPWWDQNKKICQSLNVSLVQIKSVKENGDNSSGFFMIVISCKYKETLRISTFGWHGID